MEARMILTADFLDILFDGRNKEYGAYALRKGYNRRLVIAISSMGALILLFFIWHLIASDRRNDEERQGFVFADLIMEDILPVPEKVELTPPARATPPPQVEVKKYTQFKIVPDAEASKDDMPPETQELADARIGLDNLAGIPDADITAPPVPAGNGVVEAPVRDAAADQGFAPVEIESSYPGGVEAWRRFLIKTLNYPMIAVDTRVEGTVVVQFIVDHTGVISGVEAISGPKELRDEAARVIRKSGKWAPALQNGRQVKSYKKQSIVFRLE